MFILKVAFLLTSECQRGFGNPIKEENIYSSTIAVKIYHKDSIKNSNSHVGIRLSPNLGPLKLHDVPVKCVNWHY